MFMFLCFLFSLCPHSALAMDAGLTILWFEPDGTAFTISSTPAPDALASINGGFFDLDRQPVGLLRINGIDLQSTPTRKLSGMVVIDHGTLRIVPLQEQVAATSLLQSGPFIIDPGGTPGINSDNERKYPRTAIGIGQDGRVAFIHHRGISLYQLCHQLLAQHQFERVLNLDGGPSAYLDSPTDRYHGTVTPITYINAITP